MSRATNTQAVRNYLRKQYEADANVRINPVAIKAALGFDALNICYRLSKGDNPLLTKTGLAKIKNYRANEYKINSEVGFDEPPVFVMSRDAMLQLIEQRNNEVGNRVFNVLFGAWGAA